MGTHIDKSQGTDSGERGEASCPPSFILDYLVGIEDYSRMGGLRFKDSLDGEYINASEVLRIPPLTDIRELIAASSEIEKVKRRITCLKDAGSSSLYNLVHLLAERVQRQA